MNNCTDLAQVIAFLGSAETVLTSTYHGAYWSTLLGKKVVVVDPFANRFFGMKHMPAIGAAENLQTLRGNARAYPEALEECRAANRSFGEKVAAIIEDHQRRHSA
jgi:exopolysaccharide biosynthesis predicted pyruvyltransferase EpsI